jgi:hypothetical protein
MQNDAVLGIIKKTDLIFISDRLSQNNGFIYIISLMNSGELIIYNSTFALTQSLIKDSYMLTLLLSTSSCKKLSSNFNWITPRPVQRKQKPFISSRFFLLNSELPAEMVKTKELKGYIFEIILYFS